MKINNELMMNLPPPYRLIHVLERTAGFAMTRHAHDYYQIIYVTAGELNLKLKQATLTVAAGQVCVLLPGTAHELSSSAGYSQIGIDLQNDPDERGIRQLFGQRFPAAQTVLAVPDAPVSAAQLLSKMRDLTAVNRLLITNLAERLLLHILDCAARSGNPSFLDRFLAMMCKEDFYLLTLDGMCRQMQLSKTQLERQVQAAFHCGAIEYGNRLKLNRACLLLQSTDLPIKAIGLMLGFYDESHFQSFFKKHIGQPPGRYRANECYR